MSKTIGIFGGAFDPVHVGHSSLISDIQKTIDFQKIFIIFQLNNITLLRCQQLDH